MRISDWSSDVCSSDLLCSLARTARIKSNASLRSRALIRPSGTFSRFAGEGLSDAVDMQSVTLAGPFAPIPTLNPGATLGRSEEHTSELQSLMRISYAVLRLKKKTT